MARAICDDCLEPEPLDPETGLCQSCLEERAFKLEIQNMPEDEYRAMKARHSNSPFHALEGVRRSVTRKDAA